MRACPMWCAASSSRLRQRVIAVRTPLTQQLRLFHSACVFLQPSPSITVYPARRQQSIEDEMERESGVDVKEEAAIEERKAQRPATRRRRANTFRSKAADASNLLSSSAAPTATSSTSPSIDDRTSPTNSRSRRSRSSGQPVEADANPDNAQSNGSTARSSPSSSSTSHSSSPRRPSVSALPHSSFGASSVTSRPSFGIQHVLAFVYSYLPKPTQPQIAAAQHSQRQQQQQQQQHEQQQQQHQHTSHSHYSAPAYAASLFPPPSSSSAPLPPPPPPSPPPHCVSVYDVSSRSIFNDYVVVLSVSSSRQMSFLSSALYKQARAANAAPLNRSILSLSGRTRTDWQSVDLGSVVVHVFNTRARLTRPGLDYHPDTEGAMEESTSVSAGGMWGVRSAADGGADEGLLRHAVIDNIERQFGDLMVPIDQFDTLVDYSDSESGLGEGKGQEATILVNDTPLVYDGGASTTAERVTRRADATSGVVK